MKLAIIPPHEDATLHAVAPAGFNILPLHQRFVERMLAAGNLDAEIAKATGNPQILLRLEVAKRQLARHPKGSLPWLFAANAALTALTAVPAPVQLRLDDLELPHGKSTERSADVTAASNEVLPWQPE